MFELIWHRGLVGRWQAGRVLPDAGLYDLGVGNGDPARGESDGGACIAIIPARGGSTRIPRKNIRPMSGRPLLAWTLQTTLDSGLFEHVVVSTDDDEIAAIAESCGAEVPFVRPHDLAGDFVSMAAVIRHATEAAVELGWSPDYVCCVYPTAFLVTVDDIAASGQMLRRQSKVPYVTSVVPYTHPIERALIITPGGSLAPMHPEAINSRTQDLAPTFHDAGQFHWGTSQAWQASTPVLSNSMGYRLEPWQIVDIDNEGDWDLAERLHEVQIKRVQDSESHARTVPTWG